MLDLSERKILVALGEWYRRMDVENEQIKSQVFVFFFFPVQTTLG